MTHLDPLPPTEASMPAVHVVELTANPHAKVRLFCFPFAGAGIQTFRAWAQALDPSIQVLALLLPGRENKIREPAFLRWQDLLAATFRAMQPHLNGKPFVFFGHSFGGRIAFELILQLEQCGMRLPVHFIVSGCRSPNWPNKRPFLHDLSHVEFRQALVQLDGTPEQVLREPALMRMLEPTLRADMRLAERWLRQATKISVPITAFSAVDDAIDPPDRMLDWQQATHGAFAFREFHGGHF